jgi:hypothetical protein
MGISTATQNAILKLIFNATNWALYADNTATTPQTNIAVALHTADPGIGGTQSTSEVTYTSYARVSVPRTTATPGWTASTVGSTSPTQAITFPAGTGGSGTATFFSVGATGGGATAILWSGTVTPNIVLGNGITPQLTTASTITLV